MIFFLLCFMRRGRLDFYCSIKNTELKSWRTSLHLVTARWCWLGQWFLSEAIMCFFARQKMGEERKIYAKFQLGNPTSQYTGNEKINAFFFSFYSGHIVLFGWTHHQPLCYFSAHQWYLLSGEHSLMNLAKSCWLTFPCWRHDFISVVWKWAPTRQVISMSQLEYCSTNVFPNISLSVQSYYFQVYLRTITFLSFLLSSCTSKNQFILHSFFQSVCMLQISNQKLILATAR